MTPILDRIRAHGGEVIRDKWTLRLRRGRLSAEAMEWLRCDDIRARVLMEVWPEADEWQERAAILEYDAGMARAEAEEAAYRMVMGGADAQLHAA